MAFFKVTIGEKTYELDRLTLGESRILKRDFGLDDLAYFSPGDPDQLVGLIYLCLRRERPDAPMETLVAEVEDLDLVVVSGALLAEAEKEGEDAEVPLDVPVVEPVSGPDSGGPAMTPEPAGDPSTPVSTELPSGISIG